MTSSKGFCHPFLIESTIQDCDFVWIILHHQMLVALVNFAFHTKKI